MKVRAFLAAALLAAAAAQAQDAGTRATRFQFATAAETRQLLAADDDWLPNVGPFHRAATAGRAVSRDEFRQVLQASAVDCAPAAVETARASLAGVAPRFEELGLRLPPTVTIACTNGGDSAGAPYTRGAAVFLPRNVPPSPGLMAHELFHVWSRYNAPRASRLYAVLGFSEAPPLAWPAEWLEPRILNPDAPFDRHAMRVEAAGGAYSVMPVLVARRTTLQPGETFFHVLDVRLLAVEPSADGKASVPVRRDGQPLWFDANTNESYLKQLGGNTGYVIHPEETTADNIALIVTGSAVRNPALTQRFRDVLAQLKASTP
ncbi:hypothetical protein [Ramlibacter sp. PS4R-6]|uniref:hypothetical protein n=1 Tax=Ramlibacter sp. PS4R-6 TaxID=3133438 RepID=UPI0030A8A7DE